MCVVLLVVVHSFPFTNRIQWTSHFWLLRSNFIRSLSLRSSALKPLLIADCTSTNVLFRFSAIPFHAASFKTFADRSGHTQDSKYVQYPWKLKAQVKLQWGVLIKTVWFLDKDWRKSEVRFEFQIWRCSSFKCKGINTDTSESYS